MTIMVTADLVKQLRERTGAGMMECKKALVATHGDADAAAEQLRVQGLAKADKKSSRVAAEGILVIERSGLKAAMVEVNCETDFVAKQDDFQGFARTVAARALASGVVDVAPLLAQRDAGGQPLEEVRKSLVAKIGENISVRRIAALTAPTALGSYLHGTRIGCLVALKGGTEELARDIAMHASAMNPEYVSAAEVPAEILEKERAIFAEQVKGEHKPAEILARMIEGKLRKRLAEVTLLGQPFVKDDKLTVEKLLKSAGAEVTGLVRYEVGRGIEKKTGDFVAEVMATVKGAH
ncbi:MAG TPA: translation elongation factor Ts [Steroidobacteraceae bacterium]|nr:translation elongation factor Ts [Steroidobacteraceae bacterium]